MILRTARHMRIARGIGAALALLWLPCGGAHAQSKLAAHYSLTLAGITIGGGDWTVEIDKNTYTARSHGGFLGVWRVLLGDNVSAATHGTASQGRFTPAGYEANFSWDDDVTDVRMSFRDGGVSEVETKPPVPAVPYQVPVAPTDLRGVIDPLTAGLVPVAGTGDALAPAACRRTLSIFDGSHRFEITLSFKRMDRVETEAGYRGPAVVCAMTYRPVAGYSPGTFRIDYLRKNRDMEMWLAPVAGTRVLAAIRIAVSTTLGVAALSATRFESTVR